ncbi:MAG: flagellar export chaperone FliS [Pseudomonadales bacterium]|nr:flagellar export chaperone FliS [Pseudomonadales bacterium]
MYSKQAALAQYKKINTESVVEGASPHRLIQMLMAGAIERMSQAKAAHQAKNIEQKGILLGKAISIVAGLQESLDDDKGKDIAENLDSLYDYMQRRLLEANLKNDMAMVDEVTELMATVKSSWDEIEPIH